MSLLGRWDRWQPSVTWWVLGGVLIALAAADLLNLGNYNREIMILGIIGFVSMVLEFLQQRGSKTGQAQHG